MNWINHDPDFFFDKVPCFLGLLQEILTMTVPQYSKPSHGSEALEDEA